VTDHLRRDFAPISDAGWEKINEEATRTLKHFLAARALVEFSGPRGWAHSVEPVGRVRAEDSSPGEGVAAGIRESQPLVELRTPFELSISELDRVDRGAEDPDLDALIDAARRAAMAEDTLVFGGYTPAGIAGIGPASPHDPLTIPENYDHYPRVVARAVAALRREGVGGPYAIALGPRCYTGVIETTEHGGYPLLEHIKLILGGPVVWAPAVDGAVVISLRGGDYEIVCGQDLSIGYRAHSGDTVELYLEESVTLLIKDPRAALALKYPA